MTTVQLTRGKRLSGDLLVFPVFAREQPHVGDLPAVVRRAVRATRPPVGWRAEPGQVQPLVLGSGPSRAARTYGLGKRSAFTVDDLVGWLRRVARDADRDGHRQALVVLPEHAVAAAPEAALRSLSALILSDYRFDRFRGKPAKRSLRRIRLVPPSSAESTYRKAARLAKGLAAGVVEARDLGNTPPNEATPEWIAERCRELGKELSIKVRVLTPRELQRRKMGGILAVGAGSSNPPRLVRMEWGSRGPIVALVGKGVTFDTGGISIKPAASMDEMKYDKCGACAVVGIARATAMLKLPFRFRAYLPLAENMPDGTAYRPGDIVRCYTGKTVEILNTDAEGRMILADALAWAAEEKPDHLLEYSTLTGATVVALGQDAAALYSPSDDLAIELLGAAGAAGERLWRMPLWPEFARAMKGTHADLRNLGGRWGGANQAAAFLGQFVGDHERWAHLDIAGPAYVGAGQKGTKGATGYGVGLTLLWLLRRAGKI